MVGYFNHISNHVFPSVLVLMSNNLGDITHHGKDPLCPVRPQNNVEV